MIKIYHNPQCRKSRAGLQYLQGKGVNFEIVEYLKNPLTEKQIEMLLAKLNKKPSEIIRKQEEYFKKNLKGKGFNEHEWTRILFQNPRLIQRPIVEMEYKAVIGDPVENIDLLFK
jgi:arsenate reductase (glutaredoxin)